MPFINTNELGLYAPKTNEKVKLSQEAQKYIAEAIFSYKQLFYGLRLVAWRCRDKQATFYEALTNGELDQFKVAPGHRDADGGYTKSEWDYNRLNAYMWNRFRERFDAAFNLEAITELKTLKDIKKATDELLEFALANWGQDLLGDKLLREAERVESIGKGVTRCKLEYQGISIIGQFSDTERTITLAAKGVPEVIIHQAKGANSWKGGIHFDTFGNPVTLNSQKASLFSQVLELASRLNVGIKEFMANPEGFLGLESAQAHKRNLQLIKEKLLIVNQDAYEKRKVDAPEQQATRRINEAIDAAEEVANDPDATTIEVEAARNQADRVLANERHKLPLQESLKQKREREAQQWLAQNPEFGDDLDAQLGLMEMNMSDIHKATSDNLPM